LISGVVTCALQLFAGVGLITKTDILAGLLFPRHEAEAAFQAFSPGDVQAVAFSIVGLVFIVQAIVQLPQFAIEVYYALTLPNAMAGSYGNASHRFFVDFFQMIVKLAAGAWLFWNGRVLADFWHKLRTGTGTPTSGEEE
jgi:hypothetical protein